MTVILDGRETGKKCLKRPLGGRGMNNNEKKVEKY